MSAYPVQYTQAPPEKRSRLTVFFRGIMVIPHLIWLCVYGIGFFFAVIAAWFVVLFTGKWPRGLYDFCAGFLRFSLRVTAYMYLVVDEFPPFDGGEHPEYPVTMNIAEPKAEYARWKVLLRIFLIIPVYVMEYIFSLWITVVAIALWFVAVITGRTGAGLTEAMRLPMAYHARAYAYFSLVTEDFPPFDPGTNQAVTAGGASGSLDSRAGGPESLR